MFRTQLIEVVAVFCLVFSGRLNANSITAEATMGSSVGSMTVGSTVLNNTAWNSFGLPNNMMVGVDLIVESPETIVATGLYPLWNQPGNLLTFTFTGNGGSVFEYSLGNSLGLHGMNMQTIQLPAVFNNQTIATITLTSNWSNTFARSLLIGPIDALADPEPSTMALFVSGTLGLCLLYRRKSKVPARNRRNA